jgi:hypothetical protein
MSSARRHRYEAPTLQLVLAPEAPFNAFLAAAAQLAGSRPLLEPGRDSHESYIALLKSP